MKEKLLLLIFICVSNLLLGQAKKGTHYFGSSHVSSLQTSPLQFFGKASSSTRTTIIQYGIFIKDNVLLGASFKNAPDVYWTFRPINGRSIGLNPFYRRYFGQKKIKPFVEGEFGIKFSGKNILTEATIRPGVALFLNSNTSLDLSFNLPIYNSSLPPFKIFPQGIVPTIGLALRFFLEYDRDNESSTTAKEMIKKGVLSADFSNSFLSKSRITTIDTNLGLKYFFLNNMYAKGGIDLSYINRNVIVGRIARLLSISPRFGLGGYYPLGDYTSFAIHAEGQRLFFNKKQDSFEGDVLFSQAQGKAGIALFLGRQKLEILSGVEFIQYESNVAEIPTQADAGFVFTIDYEYIVSDKLSVNASLSAYPENQRRSFLSKALRERYIPYDEVYDLNLNLSLNWFISTKKSKLEEPKE